MVEIKKHYKKIIYILLLFFTVTSRSFGQDNLKEEKYTNRSDLDSCIIELYSESGYNNTSYLLLNEVKNGIVQVGVLDKLNRFMSVAYVKRNYCGYLKIPAKEKASPTDNNVSSHCAVYYSYINLNAWNGTWTKAEINNDKVRQAIDKPRLLRILGTFNLSSVPDIPIKVYAPCSLMEDETYTHNQNCDFDNKGNCLMFYQYYENSYDEGTSCNKSKLVTFNSRNVRNTLMIIKDYGTEGVQISPFYDGVIFRLLISKNRSLFISDSNGNNEQLLKIEGMPFNTDSYNKILKEKFGIVENFPSYKYFNARNVGFVLQTKIVKRDNLFYLLINSPREDDGEIYYKVPMLLKSKDAINWEPLMLLHTIKDGNMHYVKSKGEHTLAFADSTLYIAVRGGDSCFDGVSTIYSGTTIIGYDIKNTDNRIEQVYFKNIPTALLNPLGENKPFIVAFNDRPIAVYRSNDIVYDNYPRNSVFFYDCKQDKIIGKINRRNGIHYLSGSSVNGALYITFIEDKREFFYKGEAEGKYSNIGFMKIKIKK